MPEPSKVKRLSKLMLTHKEMDAKYAELAEQGSIHPYIYKLGNSHQYLCFFGVQHSYDPQDEQFGQLKAAWSQWLKQTDSSKRIILTEGGKRPLSKSETVAIQENGEAGLATYLAHKSGVKVESPEPDRKQEADHLANQFDRDKAMYYYFARQVPQWFSINQQRGVSFDEYFDNFFKRHRQSIRWNNYDFSIEHIKTLHKQYTGKEFEVPESRQDHSDLYEQYNPASNDVSSASSHYRDKYILGRTKELWDNGQSIFIVYGSGHAIVMEPALRALIEGR